MRLFSKRDAKTRRQDYVKKQAEICKKVFIEAHSSIRAEIQSDLDSGDETFVEYAHKRTEVWNLCDQFLLRILTDSSSETEFSDFDAISWRFYSDLVYYSNFESVSGVKREITPVEIIDKAKYLNETGHLGNLLDMPGSSLKDSQNYRAYLAGNGYSGKMKWDWMNSDKSLLNLADSELAQFVSIFMTRIFDRYGLKNESGFAGTLGAAILNAWNVSEERNSFFMS